MNRGNILSRIRKKKPRFFGRNFQCPGVDCQAQKSRLDIIKDYLGLVQTFLGVLAIIAAAIWFRIQAKHVVQIDTSHVLECRKISEDYYWLGTKIKIENTGNVPVDLKTGNIRVQKVLPVPKVISDRIKNNQILIPKNSLVIGWPRIGRTVTKKLESTIRPEEKDEFDVDFIVPSYVETVRLYSYLDHSNDPGIGWLHVSYHDLCNKKESKNEKN